MRNNGPKNRWGIVLLVVLLVIAAVVGFFCWINEERPQTPQMTPEEWRRSDSIRAAYWREQDSIKEVRKKEHEEYVRKMARDIVNSGKNDSRRSNNMRGWDPASEDDSDENGMDRYMENDDERGWD